MIDEYKLNRSDLSKLKWITKRFNIGYLLFPIEQPRQIKNGMRKQILFLAFHFQFFHYQQSKVINQRVISGNQLDVTNRGQRSRIVGPQWDTALPTFLFGPIDSVHACVGFNYYFMDIVKACLVQVWVVCVIGCLIGHMQPAVTYR